MGIFNFNELSVIIELFINNVFKHRIFISEETASTFDSTLYVYNSVIAFFYNSTRFKKLLINFDVADNSTTVLQF